MIQMNRNVLKEEIQWLLEAISEQYEVIRGYEDKIPRIELDIIQENIRKLYDKINLLQKTGDPLTYFEHKTVDIIPEALRTPVVKNEPVRETVHPKEEIASKEKKEPKKPETPSETDLFSDQGSGFTERLREAREKSLGPKPRTAGAESLKSAISINEKFLFINELFDGNLRDYNENIETLNGFSDLTSAMDYLDLLRQKNLWDSQGKGFRRLRELVENKFK